MEEQVGKFLKDIYYRLYVHKRKMYLQDRHTVIGSVINEPAFLRNPDSVWELK